MDVWEILHLIEQQEVGDELGSQFYSSRQRIE